MPHTALAQQLHQQTVGVQSAVQAAATLLEQQQQQQWRQPSASPAASLLLPAPGSGTGAAAHSRAVVLPSATADAALHAAANKLMAAKRVQLEAAARLSEQVLII